MGKRHDTENQRSLCSSSATVLLSLSLLVSVVFPPGLAARSEPIIPLPTEMGLHQGKVALGEKLFHDVRLSADNSISCASCHVLAEGGSDNLARSVGIRGAVGQVNAPTVYNSGFNFVQFWDGRAASLHEQAAGPVTNIIEMGADWQDVVEKLGKDQALVTSFNELYPTGLNEQNIRDAIAVFEQSLVTSNSPFDRWLRGDKSALNDEQLRGYQLFKSYGCISCHQGVNIGGNMYARMGAMGDYFNDLEREITEADYGRFNRTGDEYDRYMFKVPSLRLAARTAPYFHDGSVATLEEAILVMARYQLGREIPAEDLTAIVAFLRALVGKHARLTQ